MPTGAAEARMRALEERIRGAELDVAVLRPLFGKAKQDLSISGGGFRGPSTLVEGSLTYGCKAPFVALPGDTLHVVGNATSTDYGNFGIPGISDYSIAMSLDPSDTTLNITWATTPPARIASGATFAVSVSVNSVNTGRNLLMPPAVGFHCAVAMCSYPLAETLDLVDSRFGSTTLTRPSPGSSHWQGFILLGGGAFITYDLDSAVTSPSGHQLISTHSAQPSQYNLETTNVTSQQCPTVGGTKFDWTWTAPTTFRQYVAGDTIRIYEP
jgi:hypothetical protein